MTFNKSCCLATAALMLSAAAARSAPQPAVARVIVQERGAISYGSGTLIHSRDQYGLVVTNWHVVRDAAGQIEVVFPDGFRSQARAVKLDEDWDLAALVIWRPPAEPARIAPRPPRPGEPLTICGYGQGDYREATGRCTDFYAPEIGMPHELVELSVEARQGDSGGPILNSRGELAGVLFGAGQGTTLGSFAPRVETFLTTLAPDIGQRRAGDTLPETPPLLAHAPTTPESTEQTVRSPEWNRLTGPQELTACGANACGRPAAACPTQGPESVATADVFAPWKKQQPAPAASEPEAAEETAAVSEAPAPEVISVAPPLWFDATRNLLAVVGVAFLFLQLVKAAA